MRVSVIVFKDGRCRSFPIVLSGTKSESKFALLLRIFVSLAAVYGKKYSPNLQNPPHLQIFSQTS